MLANSSTPHLAKPLLHFLPLTTSQESISFPFRQTPRSSVSTPLSRVANPVVPPFAESLSSRSSSAFRRVRLHPVWSSLCFLPGRPRRSAGLLTIRLFRFQRQWVCGHVPGVSKTRSLSFKQTAFHTHCFWLLARYGTRLLVRTRLTPQRNPKLDVGQEAF